jgi:hypothetical protein
MITDEEDREHELARFRHAGGTSAVPPVAGEDSS